MTFRLLLLLLLCQHPLMAQLPASFVLTGVAIDATTHKPVADASVGHGQQWMPTDTAGVFSLQLQQGDTLHVSHVGYQTSSWVAMHSPDTVRIVLTPRTYLLQEVSVQAIPALKRFKQQLLALQSDNRQELHASSNIAYARLLLLSGYVPAMDSEDNYRHHMKTPQGVSIFSTGPAKGLFQAMRQLNTHPRLPVKTASQRPFHNFSRSLLTPADTTCCSFHLPLTIPEK